MQSNDTSIRVAPKVKIELDELKRETQAHSLSDVIAMLLQVRVHYKELLTKIEDHERRIKKLEKKG